MIFLKIQLILMDKKIKIIFLIPLIIILIIIISQKMKIIIKLILILTILLMVKRKTIKLFFIKMNASTKIEDKTSMENLIISFRK